MKPVRSLLWLGLLLAAVLSAVVISTLLRTAKTGTGQLRQLPDGSELKLLKIAFTNRYSYMHQGGPPILQAIAPILPRFITRRMNIGSSGGFGFGGDGNTNLFVITANRNKLQAGGPWSSSLNRVRVTDEQGNAFDASWGANTLGLQGETIHGWQLRAFPRRTPTLLLEFLGRATGTGAWSVTSFEVPNPAYDIYPEWTPESWPNTKPAGNLAVTLKEFQSGDCISGRGNPNDPGSPRKTHLHFTFAEDGRPSENWRVQKLTLSDATGNHWFPYLDLIGKGMNWAQGGTVEFLGALWPGEKAWKLKVETVRTKGFQPEELWEVPITLPAAGSVNVLSNQLRKTNLSLKLVAIAAPNTDHLGNFKWTAKWWGADKHLVYSLALSLEGKSDGWRVIIARAVDGNGEPVKIMDHGSADYPTQAIFFKPNELARDIRLSLSLQRSRFVEFLARPQFVEPRSGQTNTPGKN